MFQGLPQGAPQIAQGATVYIFNRKDLTVSVASVTGVSQPHISKAAQANPMLSMQGFVVDVALALGSESTSIEFPVNNASANYPERGWFVSPDRLAVTREIETMVNASKQFLAQKSWHATVLQKGPALIMQLNPEMQVEAEQAQKIASLESKLADMERSSTETSNKLDKVLALLAVDSPRNSKSKKED